MCSEIPQACPRRATLALVYKIGESCANKPQRRLHLIYLQQNVKKPKLLRKCNFALRVFPILIRITWLVFNTFNLRTGDSLFGDRKNARDGSKSIELQGCGKFKMGHACNWATEIDARPNDFLCNSCEIKAFTYLRLHLSAERHRINRSTAHSTESASSKQKCTNKGVPPLLPPGT